VFIPDSAVALIAKPDVLGAFAKGSWKVADEIWWPQYLQKFSAEARWLPQLPQNIGGFGWSTDAASSTCAAGCNSAVWIMDGFAECSIFAPHLPQNFAIAGSSQAQLEQNIPGGPPLLKFSSTITA